MGKAQMEILTLNADDQTLEQIVGMYAIKSTILLNRSVKLEKDVQALSENLNEHALHEHHHNEFFDELMREINREREGLDPKKEEKMINLINKFKLLVHQHMIRSEKECPKRYQPKTDHLFPKKTELKSGEQFLDFLKEVKLAQ